MINQILGRNGEVRMAILEEKLTVYEELSREMLNKLEVAVEKISESSQNISKILIRHEEKIERSAEAHAAMIKLIENNEQKRLEDREDMRETHDKLNQRIDTLSKFMWSALGALTLATALIGYTTNLFGVTIQPPSHTESQRR